MGARHGLPRARLRLGEWQLNAGAIKLGIEDARAHVQVASIESLDEWLRLDLRDELPPWYRLPKRNVEPAFPRGLRSRLMKAAQERRVKWPRLCGTCGVEFVPNLTHRKHCPACKPSTAAQAPREAASLALDRRASQSKPNTARGR